MHTESLDTHATLTVEYVYFVTSNPICKTHKINDYVAALGWWRDEIDDLPIPIVGQSGIIKVTATLNKISRSFEVDLKMPREQIIQKAERLIEKVES